jgi:hypothetical protein
MSTQHCQSLITPGSDHSPVLKLHMVLIRVRRHRSFSTRPGPVSARRAFGLGFVAQPSNPTVWWWTPANPACRLRPWATTLHQLLSTTSSCFSCHHAAHTWSRWPSGPSSQAYCCLSTPQRPRKAKTFHTCSPPAPTQIKSQPAFAILGQESVHTTLSITHHTKEWPSIGPWMLRSSIPLHQCIDNTHIVTNSEKREKKRNEPKTQTSDQKSNKSQNKITWKSKSRSPKARATPQHNRDKVL